MKKLLLVAGLAAAIGSLGACADGYGRYGPYGYGPAPVAYDGYYDDYYGPFYDGYWGGDGAFYYSEGPGHPYKRGDGAHFRHDAAAGFHPVHGGAHAAMAHGDAGHRP